MQNTTKNYKLEINKPSREFECKITIGDNIYTNENLVNLTLEYTQPQEGFSIGNTISQSLDLTLLNRSDIIYSTSQIKVEIGLKVGSKFEYILMGIFNIDDIEKTDYTTKFTAYDNMIKFESVYFSKLGNTPTLQQVINELENKTGVKFIGTLPTYTVTKLEGFSCREVLSYVASICGGNAFITREGKFTIKGLCEVEKTIDGNNYFEYKKEEIKYKIGKISCQVDENNILSKGSISTDSMELEFENPWVTENILNDIYTKLKSVEYLGYSIKWQGDISLDPYDIITITDVKNITRRVPIFSQKFNYTGGLTSEIGAKGESKNKNSFSSSGSTSNKVNRVVMEQAVIKEALINKANIRDLEASNAKIENLQVKAASIESAIIGVAYISDLTAINANIQNLIAADAKINTALINKADITELNAVQGNITSLNSQIANIQTLVNGNLSSENIQAGGITSDKLTIANGFITNAMIANLDVSKINAGEISTNKFRIVSDNGGIEIVGATQQFKDKNNKVRIQMGQDAKGNFNFILRGEDGTTTLIDNTGIKEKAIADNLIKGNMVATDAIGEKQINYSSLITGLNKDTNTQLIKASKVAIDLAGQTLDLAFNSLKNQADNNKNIIENHSTNISAMQGQISTAINNTQIVKDGKTILLKDDYNRTISKVDSINSTIGTHTTKINELTGNIISVDTKVNSVQRDLEGTKSTVGSHSTQISDLNSTVSTQGASISQLKNQIALKVEATDITTAINNMQIDGRNAIVNSTGNLGNTNYWSNVVLDTSKKIEGCNSFKITRTNYSSGNPRHQGAQTIDLSRLSLQANDYITLSGWVYVDSSVSLSGSSNNFAFRNYYDSSNNFEDLCIFNYGNVTKNTWTKFSITSKVTKASYKAGTVLLSIGGNGLIWVSKLKLEKGTKATGWTLAIEDVDSSIADVQKQVTNTSNKVATIETNLNSITQRVSSTESKLTSTTTVANTALNNTNNMWSKYYAVNTDTILAIKEFNDTDNLDPKYWYEVEGFIDATGTNNGALVVFKGNGTTFELEKIFEKGTGSNHVKLFLNDGVPSVTLYNHTSKYTVTCRVKRVPRNISTTVSLEVTKTQVATIETNLSSITQKVSSVENTTATINGNVTNLTNRVSTAESKLTATSLTTTISSAISGGTSSISTTQFVMDKNGLTIKNGALTIKNKAGTTVFSGDTAGNLKLAGSITSEATITGGTLKSSNNDMYFDLNGGYMLLYNNGTKIGQTNKNRITGTSIYGVSNGAEYGKYSTLSAKTSPSDAAYSMMMTVSGSDLTSYISKGVNLGANLHTNNWHFRMGKSSELCWRQSGSSYDSFITEGAEGMLRLYGDNGMYLGYREGATNSYVIAIRESGSHDYPRALNMFNSERDIPSNGEYAVEITAPLKMRGQTINECSNIKTLGLEIVEPLAFYSDDSEETTTTYTVTKNNQNIVEFVGSAEIISGEVTVPLPDNIVFRNYVVLLTAIGSNRNVSLVEKSDDSFKLIGDNGTVDYVIKFESVDYSRYMAKSISIDAVDNIQRSEDDLPKVIELSEDSSPFIDVPIPLEAV